MVISAIVLRYDAIIANVLQLAVVSEWPFRCKLAIIIMTYVLFEALPGLLPTRARTKVIPAVK